MKSSSEEIYTELIENDTIMTTTDKNHQTPMKKVHFDLNIIQQNRVVQEICINILRNIDDNEEEEEII